MMKRFLQTDLVGPVTLKKLETCLSELSEYIAGFPSVLKLSVSLVGSYSNGFASRSGSMVDLIIRMDGGALTASLDSDQLAMALSAGLKDWSYLTNLTPLGNNSGTLICETRDSAIILRIRACNTETFPVSIFFHSKLLHAYSKMDPKIVVLVTGLKHWARISGFSSPIPHSQCPLSGFHWTLLTLVFLSETNRIPNLHALKTDRVVQYGPGKYFSLSASGTKKLGPVEALFESFFKWLSDIDLLARSISLTDGGFRKGWITIVDPCDVENKNTVDTMGSQKDQVLFAMKLQREAKVMAASSDVSELIYAKKVSMLSSGDGPVHRVDMGTSCQ